MKQDSYATKLGVGTWGLNVPVRSDRVDLDEWRQEREQSTASILSEETGFDNPEQPVCETVESQK